jgi:hypothetical protein
MKLEQPKDYTLILDSCVRFLDGRIDRKELDKKLDSLDCDDKQFEHIWQQAENLTGIGTSKSRITSCLQVISTILCIVAPAYLIFVPAYLIFVILRHWW